MIGVQRLLHCVIFAIILLTYVLAIPARSEERLSVSYAALGGANSIWNIAKEAGYRSQPRNRGKFLRRAR
jgi:hypothetical protein